MVVSRGKMDIGMMCGGRVKRGNVGDEYGRRMERGKGDSARMERGRIDGGRDGERWREGG